MLIITSLKRIVTVLTFLFLQIYLAAFLHFLAMLQLRWWLHTY